MCDIVHQYGGQVYLDGANMNAQVRLTAPGFIGADVSPQPAPRPSAIPHGGGSPGMGPIGVKQHLAPFVAGHAVKVQDRRESRDKRLAVSAARSVRPASCPSAGCTFAMLGTRAENPPRSPSLNANYLARLGRSFPVLYTGRNGPGGPRGCILDVPPAPKACHQRDGRGQAPDGLRLPRADHELPGGRGPDGRADRSRIKRRLDRFVEAMTAIRAGDSPGAGRSLGLADNPLVRTPHPG